MWCCAPGERTLYIVEYTVLHSQPVQDAIAASSDAVDDMFYNVVITGNKATPCSLICGRVYLNERRTKYVVLSATVYL